MLLLGVNGLVLEVSVGEAEGLGDEELPLPERQLVHHVLELCEESRPVLSLQLGTNYGCPEWLDHEELLNGGVDVADATQVHQTHPFTPPRLRVFAEAHSLHHPLQGVQVELEGAKFLADPVKYGAGGVGVGYPQQPAQPLLAANQLQLWLVHLNAVQDGQFALQDALLRARGSRDKQGYAPLLLAICRICPCYRPK